MKEFLFVEFLFTVEEHNYGLSKLEDLGDDFVFLKSDYEFDTESDLFTHTVDYVKVSGRINSMTASLIKLQDPIFAGKMRFSYISDELKNRYRK